MGKDIHILWYSWVHGARNNQKLRILPCSWLVRSRNHDLRTYVRTATVHGSKSDGCLSESPAAKAAISTCLRRRRKKPDKTSDMPRFEQKIRTYQGQRNQNQESQILWRNWLEHFENNVFTSRWNPICSWVARAWWRSWTPNDIREHSRNTRWLKVSTDQSQQGSVLRVVLRKEIKSREKISKN